MTWEKGFDKQGCKKNDTFMDSLIEYSKTRLQVCPQRNLVKKKHMETL